MPKSKRSRTYHLTQTKKGGREARQTLFDNVREAVGQYQHCLVFAVHNERNNHLKFIRKDLREDSRIFFGKCKLMARALGLTPEEACAPNLDRLAAHISGAVGLIFTNRDPQALADQLGGESRIDFARAGAVAPREFVVPPGFVYSTAGEVPQEYDVPIGHTVEPLLRKLGMPTSIVKGEVYLGTANGNTLVPAAEGYVVCREGDVLDSRQTRLLKLFSVCLSEFTIKILAYWSAASEEVTELEEPRKKVKTEKLEQMPTKMDGIETYDANDVDDVDDVDVSD